MNQLIAPFVVLACLLILPAPVAATVYYVSPTGHSHAAGTAEAPFNSLNEAAWRAQPGDVIRVAAGVYTQAEPIHLEHKGTAAQPIRVEPASAERPVFDFSAQVFTERHNGIDVAGDYWHVVGLEVMGAAHNGIYISGQHNIVERCAIHDNQDTGLHIGGDAAGYNLVLDCESYHNLDRPTHGENADGFSAKFKIGPGNVFRGCRSWENADDGYDLWRASEPVRIEYCTACRNGINVWNLPGFTGNGNGFKLGGDHVPAAHVVIGCTAMDQPVRGFDENNNTAGLTIEHCTAIRCQTGYAFTGTPVTGKPHVLRDNISWDAPARLVEGTVSERNLWFDASGKPQKATIVQPAQK